MLATRGFENKHSVKIYENQVIINETEMKIAEDMNDPIKFPVPNPVVETRVYIEATAPQSKSNYNGPITPRLKKSFPLMWKSFLDRKDKLEVTGTLIIDGMPDISTNIQEKLQAMGIQTIEHLAEISDSAIGRIPLGVQLRERAKIMLRTNTDSKIDDISDELAEMREIIAEQAEANRLLTEQLNDKKAKKANVG
jgi:hypothetical protein